MVEIYREQGAGMSLKKLGKLFVSAPEYVYLFIQNQRLAQKMKYTDRKDVSDLEVYDFYFSGIEEVFSAYGSKIVVLFMPNTYFNEEPGDELIKAVDAHPGVLFVNGYKAIEKHNVPGKDYVRIHPRPRAHEAYAREILKRLEDMP
jgi:hypothetical protein